MVGLKSQGNPQRVGTSRFIEGDELCALLDLPFRSTHQKVSEELRRIVTACNARYSSALTFFLPEAEKPLVHEWRNLKKLIEVPEEGGLLASRFTPQSDIDEKALCKFKDLATELTVFTPDIASSVDVIKGAFDRNFTPKEIPDSWKICLAMRHAFSKYGLGALTKNEMTSIVSAVTGKIGAEANTSISKTESTLRLGTTDLEWRWSPSRKRYEPAFANSRFISGDSTLIGLSRPYRNRMLSIYEKKSEDPKIPPNNSHLYTMEIIKLCGLVASGELGYSSFVARMSRLNFHLPMKVAQ